MINFHPSRYYSIKAKWMKITILLLLLFATLFSSQNIAKTPLSDRYEENQKYYLQLDDSGLYHDSHKLIYKYESTGMWWGVVLLLLSMFVAEAAGEHRHIKFSNKHKVVFLFGSLFLLYKFFQYHCDLYEFDTKKGYLYHYQVSKNGDKKVLKKIAIKDIVAIQRLSIYKYKLQGRNAEEKIVGNEVNLILHDKKRINLFANKSPLDIELKSSFISENIHKKIIKNSFTIR